MALEERHPPVRRHDVTVRTAEEIRADERDAVRRAEVTLRVILVTLFWAVSVSLLVGWGFTGSPAPVVAADRPGGNILALRAAAEQQHGGAAYVIAAALVVLLPFVGAVIATRDRRFFLGGSYVVLTLLMVVPAISLINAAG
jgi:hypothetical protein